MKIFIVTFILLEVVRVFTKGVSEEFDSSEHGVIGMGNGKTTCNCGWANRWNQRIVSGQETQINQFPFVVGLLKGGIFCGGTILTKKHIVTAAHCTYKLSPYDLLVVVGEHDRSIADETDVTEMIEVASIENHPKYDYDSDVNDISILVLKKDITFSEKVGPACLPRSRNQYNLVNKYVKVMGWGRIIDEGDNSPFLKHVNLKVVPLELCKESFFGAIDTADPKQVCTYSQGKDSCQGDSGGPLLYVDPDTNRYTLIGVVSYGRGCAAYDPGVNTDVSAYLDWIQSIIKRTSKNMDTCNNL